MKETLQPGLKYSHTFTVPVSQTVPALYPEALEFVAMPAIFATGFMVGFLEWACIKAISPYLEGSDEQTLGTHINVSHQAPTPPGMTVTAHVELIAIEGRKLIFNVEAFDNLDLISRGTHERFLIQRHRFDQKMAGKLDAWRASSGKLP